MKLDFLLTAAVGGYFLKLGHDNVNYCVCVVCLCVYFRLCTECLCSLGLGLGLDSIERETKAYTG